MPMMKAYLVHNGDDDSRESVIVYHYTEEAAKELGRNCLTSTNSWEETEVERVPAHDARCVSMTEPEQEEDAEYLREQGWRYEDEKTCHSCGLAAFGQEEFAVCNECNHCKECGCATTCDESDEPCKQSEGWSYEEVRKPKPSPTLEVPSSDVSTTSEDPRTSG